MSLERLDKIIASQGTFSRSGASKLIKNGAVSVNGLLVLRPEQKSDPETDEIKINSVPICFRKHIYIMLNKPAGVISVSNDPKRMTAVGLIGPEYHRAKLFPAGRLDMDSTGFLLITDDGDFAHRILSPRSHIEKTYIVTMDAIPENAEKAFENGITLCDGTECMKAEYTFLSSNPPTACIVLHEGKYHQIKRMLGTLGAGVCSLKRIKMGELELDYTLEPGQYRLITDDELRLIEHRPL